VRRRRAGQSGLYVGLRFKFFVGLRLIFSVVGLYELNDCVDCVAGAERKLPGRTFYCVNQQLYCENDYNVSDRQLTLISSDVGWNSTGAVSS